MDTDEGRHLAQALQSTFTPSQSYPARFPRTIWQAWLGPDEHGHEKFAERTETWKKVKGFEHKILHGIANFVIMTLAGSTNKQLQKPML
jgi:mannosyltransferase OCH1-like enzyme